MPFLAYRDLVRAIRPETYPYLQEMEYIQPKINAEVIICFPVRFGGPTIDCTQDS